MVDAPKFAFTLLIKLSKTTLSIPLFRSNSDSFCPNYLLKFLGFWACFNQQISSQSISLG